MKFNRVQDMEAYVIKHNSATIDKLCEEFGVSKNTIRRDINELLEKGSIEKIYGGVVAKNQNLLSSFDERDVKNCTEKAAIGRKAATFVKDNDIIFIDSGTTVFQMIQHIGNVKNLTVITNNLQALMALFNCPNIDVISIGGSLSRKTSSFTGIDSINTLKNYNISKSFMATTGVSIGNGLTNSTAPEFELKKTIIQRSDAIYLLADSSKFGVSSLMTFHPLEGIDYLVTDKKPEKKYIDFCHSNDIELVIA